MSRNPHGPATPYARRHLPRLLARGWTLTPTRHGWCLTAPTKPDRNYFEARTISQVVALATGATRGDSTWGVGHLPDGREYNEYLVHWPMEGTRYDEPGRQEAGEHWRRRCAAVNAQRRAAGEPWSTRRGGWRNLPASDW